MAIRKLSPLLVNQIAAGEVIERPASVVKELIENALDAEARQIDVQVEAGGRELIRVADDGVGIAADEVALAVAPHATSKIASAEDLAAISTMGFRGEALASIASVSRLRLTSRRAEDDAAAMIETSGEEVGEVRPASGSTGTRVEVRNLFFNTPARRKFLRAESTEFGHIHELLRRTAMAHPGVGFKLTHNARGVFDVPPGQAPRPRCLAVLGEDMEEAMLEFDSDERGIGLWGLAGLPSLAKSNTKYQYVYVNRRPVRDRHIMHAMKEAYRGLMEPARQPMVVLFIELDPREVDVNVHPAKAEVRFADGNQMHGAVLAVMRQRLLAEDLTPQVGFGASAPAGEDRSDAGRGFELRELPGDPEPTLPLGSGSPSTDAGRMGEDRDASTGGPKPRTDEHAVRQFVDYFRRMNPTQKGFVYQQVREELGYDPSADPDASEDEKLTDDVRPSATKILQVHDSYIVTQDETGLVIVDQHALHERMMFQQLYDRIRNHGRLESQRLLTPAPVEASGQRGQTLEAIEPLLDRLGIEAAPTGPSTIGVQAFPTLLFDRGVEPGAFVAELLDRAEEDDFHVDDEGALHEVIDMMSCKAAIRAGDAMSEQELAELLRRRGDLERSSHCPHGRPTTVRLTLRDLEKHFKRS